MTLRPNRSPAVLQPRDSIVVWLPFPPSVWPSNSTRPAPPWTTRLRAEPAGRSTRSVPMPPILIGVGVGVTGLLAVVAVWVASRAFSRANA